MYEWEMDLGAKVLPNGTSFKVWAPKCSSVDVVIIENGYKKIIPMDTAENGYFSKFISNIKDKTHYKYRLNNDENCPDPCSRYQPEGVHGPSMVIDPKTYRWCDSNWKGINIKGQIIYELHVGAFTKEGTFNAAAKELKELKDLGVTVVEIMPIAEFPGRWGWGYDGVDLFAPSHLYGSPDDFKLFVNTA